VEEQFPRAGKPKPGVTEVIAMSDQQRGLSTGKNAAPANPIPSLKRTLQIYNASFSENDAAIPDQDRSTRPKNSSNGQLLPEDDQ